VVANEARAATIAAVIDAVRVADRGRRRHHGRAGSVVFGDMYVCCLHALVFHRTS
jgi:hypothetical protein